MSRGMLFRNVIIFFLFLLFSLSIFFNLGFLRIEHVFLENSTYSIERRALSLVGRSMYSFSFFLELLRLKGIPYVDDLSFSYSDHELKIQTDLKDLAVLVTDGTDNIVFLEKGGFPISAPDAVFLAKRYPVLYISSEQFLYLSSFSTNKQIKEILFLIMELFEQMDYNKKLIGNISFSSGSGLGFGVLKFYLPEADSVLTVREETSAERLKKSLEIIFEKREFLPIGYTKEYEIRNNILMEQKRVVNGGR